MNSNWVYKKNMDIATGVAYGMLHDKIKIQGGIWQFDTPVSVAAKHPEGEKKGRVIFQVCILKIGNNDFGDEAINAQGDIFDGETLRQDMISSDIFEDFLPSEFQFLEDLIPDRFVDRPGIDRAWDEVPEAVNVITGVEGTQDTVKFDKANRTIYVKNCGKIEGNEALLGMNSIVADRAAKGGTIEEAVARWYNTNNFDLPF